MRQPGAENPIYCRKAFDIVVWLLAFLPWGTAR